MQVIQVPSLRIQTIPEPPRDHPGSPGRGGAWYANRPKSVFYILGPEIKTFEFWYCITQGCEIQEFWRSEISGKSDSSEAMTFRYIPDMINLTFFFIWKVKIKGMQLYLSTYIFVLSVSSIEAWTRLKYWKVIRLMEKLWCPHRNFIFKQPEIYVEGSQSGRSWVKADGRKPTVIFHKVH